MTDANNNTMRAKTLWISLLTLSCCGLLFGAPAQAAYQQVGTFAGVPGLLHTFADEGKFPEEVQLGAVSGMAVNYTGAGGVPAGTVYAIGGHGQEEMRVARYNPDRSFSEAWEPTLQEGPYQRCGPEGEAAHPHCSPLPNLHGGLESTDVDVDQTTGNVYVLTPRSGVAGTPRITEYSADGSELITRFGQQAAAGETVPASPAKIHEAGRGGIAVNAAGEVYVFDEKNVEHFRRLMVFKPKTPGDYTNYEYAGQSRDIVAGASSFPEHPVVDAAGNVYAGGGPQIEEYDPIHPADPPICSFKFKKGGITSITVDPLTGEVFFFSYQDLKVHRLNACAGGKFTEAEAIEFAPGRSELGGLALDPASQFDPARAAGILYAGSPDGSGGVAKGEEKESSMGFVFAPPNEAPPRVVSESVSAVTSSSARLEGKVDPKGNVTQYAFQYIPDAAYQANEPDERQSLTIAASGGLLGVEFEGEHNGGVLSATLTAGSKVATKAATATGTATLKAATGKGDLNGSTATGTEIEGSSTLTAVSPGKGSFEVGQTISGDGIPAATTITAITPEGALSTNEITISKPATKSAAHVALTTGSATLTTVSTDEGAFEIGQVISGQGIFDGTTIVAVGAGELTLSKPVRGPEAGVTLQAGSTVLTAVSLSFGSFKVGQGIEGTGIPSGASVTAVKAGELTISAPVIKPGTGIEISHPSSGSLAVGETVEGAGVPPGTTITALGAGGLTLSNPATVSGSGVVIHGGVPADASASQLQRALEGLSTIGIGGVQVSGGPGDETGSSPYEIVFTGAHENVDVPQLVADSSDLSGAAATATVQTEHDGGAGFIQGASEVPAGGGHLEGSAPLPVADAIAGLQPDAGYHYRLTATNHCKSSDQSIVCEGVGVPKGFRTFVPESPVLPDHRAYELVSPAQKNGGQVLPANPEASSCFAGECKPGFSYNHFPMQSTPDGEAIAYEGSPFSFDEGALIENQYIARRGASSWQTVNLTPSRMASKGGIGGYQAFTADLGKGLLLEQYSVALSPTAPAEFSNIYTQPSVEPTSLDPLLTEAPPNREPGNSNGLRLSFAGASADFSRVYFGANDALSEGAQGGPEAKRNLYERSEGELHLVNLAPGNAETLPGAVFGSAELLGRGDANTPEIFTFHSISADGSRAFWTSEENGHLYVREEGETRQVPDPNSCATSLTPSQRTCFLTAADDGSRVLLSDGLLFDVEDLEAPPVDLTGGKGGFEGVAGQSEDLSRIYFVDTKILTGGEENGQGDKAQEGEGKFNLYAWHDGVTSFVATLPASGASSANWELGPAHRSASASPDGRWLAFMSQASLSGFDNTGPCERISGTVNFNNGPCVEVFLYQAETGELHCPSCNRTGAPPHGPSHLLQLQGASTLPPPRYLTDSGRLFFDSQDSLSPFDTNGRVEDVYEFEPSGIGDCSSGADCVRLISAGRSGIDSNFLAMDPSGKNVFFTGRDQLVPADKDDLVDLYDAREGGGFPPEVGAAECQGEACLPSVSPPNDPTPASAGFKGPGNPSTGQGSGRCPKGRHAVKRKGKARCVKSQTKRQHHKRHNNRGGAK
jgi:hypothetical protein